MAATAALNDDIFNDPVVYKSLGFAAVQGLLSVLLAYLLARRSRHITTADKVGLLWLVYSGMVHFTLVGLLPCAIAWWSMLACEHVWQCNACSMVQVCMFKARERD